MGTDKAPTVEVAASIEAVQRYPVEVYLVGLEGPLRAELAKHPGWEKLPIRIVPATEVITMDDQAAKAVRSKKDSSVRVASRMVREGEVAGFVSAGNTGAVMATAKMVQGMVPGVDRPALATVFPTRTGHPVVVLDMGANVDCTPEMLAQFAVMGNVYSRAVLHVAKPRVGILSIGEEEHKGNELTKAATPLLKELPLKFTGNVEGRDIFKGETVDVVVCDGFVGNIVLKLSEGLADMFVKLLKQELTATFMAKAGAFLSRGAFASLRKRIDYSEYGGAPLLGVKGVCIICHGSSNVNAVKNAIRFAAEYAAEGVNTRIERDLDGHHSSDADQT
ncbi:MAG: phosphate acyltransferase PlsX [Acidobacteria bacterium]|nr:phosphate acyltransferase PlsX [Acidobacteriota bacterium]